MEFINLQSLVYKYSNRGIFIDTEPLFVYVVGRYKPSELSRVERYNEEDYEIVASFLSKFNRIVITSYVIAELSNLINSKMSKFLFRELILGCVAVLKNCDENHIGKDKVLNRREAQWLGFSDASIIISSEIRDLLLLSEDGGLIRECEKLGINTVDFSSLRAFCI